MCNFLNFYYSEGAAERVALVSTRCSQEDGMKTEGHYTQEELEEEAWMRMPGDD